MRKHLLVLQNGAVGAEKQAVALSQKLVKSLRTHEKTSAVEICTHFTTVKTDKCCKNISIEIPSNWFKWLPPQLHLLLSTVCGNPFLGYKTIHNQLKHLCETVDVVIGCGRSTVPFNAALGKFCRNNRKQPIFTIQIQHPRVPFRLFDAVVLPKHDILPECRGSLPSHVYLTRGTVHNISPKLLGSQQENSEWRKRIESLKGGKKICVLIGGSCRGYSFGVKQGSKIAEMIAQLCDLSSDCSFLISFSRRTPNEAKEVIYRGLRNVSDRKRVLIYDEAQKSSSPGSENPYMLFLALAKSFIVTPDSVSMITEAIATNKHVEIFEQSYCKGKFQRFHSLINAEDLGQDFTISTMMNFLNNGGELNSSAKRSTSNSEDYIVDEISKALCRNWYPEYEIQEN